MKVSVYDTYITRKDGGLMHFDILVPASLNDTATIHQYGHAYLKTKGEEGQPLTARECRFCHVEEATEKMKTAISSQGFYIIEMEGC